MNSDLIVNKADFQRHLNGCERRLNEFTKSIQTLEKLSLNNPQQETILKSLNDINSQAKFLYSSLLTLDQCSFASNTKKRLDLFKINLEKNRIKFEQIQQYVQVKYDYDFKQNDSEEDLKVQSMKLIDKEQIELDLIHHRTLIVKNLEQDLTDLKGAFYDINRIIHEQGTIVDNIEQALTNTDEMVYEATENVKTTVQEKKRSTRTKWILICFLISLVLLAIIILYVTLKLASPFG